MVAALALSLLFTYDGGDTAEFVESYASSSNSCVVVAASRPMPPIELQLPLTREDAKGYEKVAAAVAGNLDAKLVGISGFQVFRPLALPHWFAPGWSEPEFNAYGRRYVASADVLRVVDGRVEVATAPKRYLACEQLEKAPFTKHVKVHWMLRHYRLAAAGRFGSEKDFLRCVAKAIGGDLRDKPDAYEIALDPAAYRKQLEAYWVRLRGHMQRSFDIAYIDFRIHCIRSLSNAQICQAMATEGSYLSVRVAWESPAGRAASALVKAYVSEVVEYSMDPLGLAKSRQRMLEELADFDQPPTVYVSAQRGVLLRLRAKDGPGAVEL